jgi:hypothetical protein
MGLLRLPLAAARLPVELALAVTRGALAGATRLAEAGYRAVASSDETVAEPVWGEPPPRREPPPPRREAPPPPPRQEAPPPPVEPPPARAEPVRPPDPVRPPEPVGVEPAVEHVSEEPTLVADSAEIGAEEGAGAEVEVSEPWPGYNGMRAPEIRARLATEGSTVAAAVSLYEASHKGRTSVLDAARRAVGA